VRSDAVVYGDQKAEVVGMLIDAGYDVGPERAALLLGGAPRRE